MKDIKEVIYGKDYSDKYKEFIDVLGQIEEKHIDFFKERPARNEYGKHDRLHNHYGMITEFGTLTFSVGDSELPANIQNECVDAFNSIFNKTK